VLLNQAKYIYELTPLGALALRPLCKTPSPALMILEVDPSANPISSLLGEGLRPSPQRRRLGDLAEQKANPIQFALFLNQKMEEQ